MNISKEDIKNILSNPDKRFYDISEDTEIAIGKISINEKQKPLIVVYTITEDRYYVITAYPCSNIERETKRKLRDKRWIKLE